MMMKTRMRMMQAEEERLLLEVVQRERLLGRLRVRVNRRVQERKHQPYQPSLLTTSKEEESTKRNMRDSKDKPGTGILSTNVKTSGARKTSNR